MENLRDRCAGAGSSWGFRLSTSNRTHLSLDLREIYLRERLLSAEFLDMPDAEPPAPTWGGLSPSAESTCWLPTIGHFSKASHESCESHMLCDATYRATKLCCSGSPGFT